MVLNRCKEYSDADIRSPNYWIRYHFKVCATSLMLWIEPLTFSVTVPPTSSQCEDRAPEESERVEKRVDETIS